MNVESAFDYFYDLFDRLVNENIPRIHIKKNNNKPKWWTRELQKKKNKRDKMYKRKPKNEMSPEYTEALEEFNKLQDELYKNYIDQVQANICSNPSEFWKYAKSKQQRPVYPLEMYYNDQRCDEPKEIVELFANYFEDIYERNDEDTVFEEIYKNEPAN